MAWLVVLGSLCPLAAAQQSTTDSSRSSATPLSATHVLGFEGVGRNVRGSLTIEGGALQFRRADDPACSVSIASIQDMAVGSEDRQVGGVPMTLGKAAVPYGGGRVISLISHKKFETLTLEYLDGDGGLHGAIVELDKGAGQMLRDELIREGAHVSSTDTPAGEQNSPGAAK